MPRPLPSSDQLRQLLLQPTQLHTHMAARPTVAAPSAELYLASEASSLQAKA